MHLNNSDVNLLEIGQLQNVSSADRLRKFIGNHVVLKITAKTKSKAPSITLRPRNLKTEVYFYG